MFYPVECDLSLPGDLIKQTELDSAINETSGLLYLDGNIWTFNDSGGDPALYCVDPANGKIIRSTNIKNAVNRDWEDIAADDSHVYIADVGNNRATRDTVLIYRILKSSLLSGDPDISINGIISVSFNEKVTTNEKGYSSHDCEALFAFGDSLYLYSKDWVGESTSVYVVPRKPDHYHVRRSFQYEARILVTGADIWPGDNQVALVGYRDACPIVITYRYGGDPGRIECGGRARIYPLKRGRQVEGICYDPDGNLLISAERRLHSQALFKLGPLLR